jgi:predicted metal-dependent phosphoesterase TrpH
MRIDFHLHTRASMDSLSDPAKVLERALACGLDRIAITDHNSMAAALEMAADFPDRIIPGEEVKTAEGVDVIGLYLVEEIPKGTPAEATCRRIHEQGGLVYLPHPYARGKGGSGRLAETLAPLLDIVEVFNGRLSPARDRPAVELAERRKLPRGAGSDAHTVGEVGRTWVELPEHPNDAKSLLAALERGVVHGTKAPGWVRIASNWAKIRKKLIQKGR